MIMNGQLLPIKINEWSQIVEPPFHDSNLIGILLKEPKSVVLFINDEEEKCYRVEMSGLIRLKVSDFLEGNIVLHTSILNGPEIDSEMVAEVYNVDFEKEKSKKYFQEVVANIQERKLMLLSVVPSVGCSLLAVCEDIKIYLINPIEKKIDPLG